MRGSSVEETQRDGSAAEGASDEARLQCALFPLRFLGLGLWNVWQWCTHWSATLCATGTLADVTLFRQCDLTMRLVDIATMVVLALLWRRLTPIADRRGLQAAGAACIVAGSLGVLGVTNGLVTSSAVALTVSALASFGGAVLFLSWAEVYSRLEPNRMLLMGVLSMALAGLVSCDLNFLAEPLPLAGTIAAPALSYVLCRMSSRYAPAREVSARAATAVNVTFPYKPVVVMAFAGLVAGFGNFSLFGQTANTRMGATFTVAVCMLAAFILFKGRLRLTHLVYAAFALTAAGLVLTATMGVSNPVPAAFLVMMAYVALCVTGLALLGRLSYMGGVPSLWLFGFGRAASELTMGLGTYAKVVPGVSQFAQDGHSLAVLAAVGLACLVFVAALWQSERSEGSNWAVDMVDARSGAPVETEREALVRGCARLARECDITERELEVLKMLVLGLSYQEICQSLLLSMGTVKTHVRHVYAKVGVHAREEAVERARVAAGPTKG